MSWLSFSWLLLVLSYAISSLFPTDNFSLHFVKFLSCIQAKFLKGCMYADRKRWLLKEIQVVLTHSKNYAKDCVNCEQPAAMLDRIERRITLIGELSAEQRQKLLVIANLCPLHKSLTSKIDVQTELVDPSL